MTELKHFNKTSVKLVSVCDTSYINSVTLHVQLSIADGLMYGEIQAQSSGTTYHVPKGKRLIIETVSASMDIPASQKAYRIAFRPEANGISKPEHYLWPQLTAASITDADFYTIDARQIRVIADEGDALIVSMGRSGSTGQANLHITWTGYLINRKR